MTEKKPWDYHSDLTRERLIQVAALLVTGRNDAVSRFAPSIGSNGWTVGCEAFQFGCHRITVAAATESYEWLSVQEDSKRFTFHIGKVPVRFYKGPPDAPSQRTLAQTYSELRQLSLSFPDKKEGSDLAFRFAVEADMDGAVWAITFVGLREETPVLSWPVPLEEATAIVVDIAGPKDEGVELPKPTVRAPAKKHRISDSK